MVVALAIAGCTDGGAPAAAPGTFTVGVREPAGLLPAQVTDVPGRMITGALWTPLTSHDPETHEVTRHAAASIDSQDQRVWIIRLKPGMRFHDGSAVTARSYVGAWQAAMRERWPGAVVLTDVLRAKDIRAVDDATIELSLDRPFAQVPLVLGSAALYPLPDSVLTSRDWAGFARQPVGTGPYRMAEPWQRGSGARLVRFEQSDNPGKATEIGVRVVQDPAAQYDQARAGALDLATELPGASHDAMRSQFGDRHLQWPLPEAAYLGFPPADQRFQNPVVRHAFALGVDRTKLEGALDRQVDGARGFLPPSVALGPRSGPCRPCNHDPGAAKALLGQAEGFAGPVRLFHEAGQEAWVGVLAEQLRGALGIEVAAATGPGDGPAVVTRRLFTASPREAMAGIAGYAGAGYDDLLASADAAAGPADSAQLYRVAENQLLRDLPMVPLWSRHGHAVWSQRIAVGRSDPVRDIDLAAVHVNG